MLSIPRYFLTGITIVQFAVACSANSHHSDPQRVRRSEAQFKIRDDCLKQNAAAAALTPEDVAIAAAAIARSCQAQSDKLNEIVNASRAADVTNAVQQDTLFRATGFILKARGAPAIN